MNEKFRITRKSISIAGGICFILFAFVTLFSNNTPFKFLSNIIVNALGFVGYWLILPFVIVLGFYLILKKKFVKLKLGVELWGVFIVIICFIILSSHWGAIDQTYNGVVLTGFGRVDGTAKYLTFSNSTEIFKQIINGYDSQLGPTPKTGGGRIGFILAGAINSSLTPVGLNLICWTFFIGGMFMIFYKQISKFVNFLKRKIKGSISDQVYKEISIAMPEVEIAKPVEVDKEAQSVNSNMGENLNIESTSLEKTKETPKAPQAFENKPIFESFHTSSPINNEYDLKKAHFVISDEEKPLEKKEDDFSKATFFQEEQESVPEEVESIEAAVEEEPALSIESENKEYSEPFFEPLMDKASNEEEEKIEEEASLGEDVEEEKEESIEDIPFEYRPQPKAEPSRNYVFPSIDLLDENKKVIDSDAIKASCESRIEIINKTFSNLGIGAQVVSYTVGPSVTRFDVQTNDDVSVTAIPKYIQDISVRLGGIPVRYEAIVAGKSTSGLEVPNEIRTNVTLKDAMKALNKEHASKLDIPFGKSISGELKFANLTDFPHMLVAGTTGSGKSIFVHSTIISLLLKNRPEELKLILVDPKKVEMSYYDDIPHLLCPVISDVRKVYVCFTKLVSEMERRYNLFQKNRVRNIGGFNEFAKAQGLQPLPYIVVFIDEYADLVETCKEVREPVVKLVQKARAAGIHMVFATQRPSVDVIDGNIKANVSTRVALMCASSTDSMTVIGEGGAEKLLGNGDMLIECSLISRSMKPRVQGCYVSETEINRVCDFLREHYRPQFDPMYLNLNPVVEQPKASSFEDVEVAPLDKEKTDEEVYQRIKEDAKHREFFSISYITRTYNMGYSRAGKMFRRLQNEGVVELEGDSRGCKVIGYIPGGENLGSVEQSSFIPDEEN